MKVMINSVHFKASSDLEGFITQKVEKVCSKYAEVIGAEVNLKLDNTDTPENKIADIRLMLKGDDLIRQQAVQDLRGSHRYGRGCPEETIGEIQGKNYQIINILIINVL